METASYWNQAYFSLFTVKALTICRKTF